MNRTIAFAAAALLLAGCSGGGDTPQSLAEVGERIGCTGFALDAPGEVLMVRASAHCTLPGGEAALYDWGSAEVAKAMGDEGAALGLTPDVCPILGRWQVCPEDADVAAVRAAL